MIKMKISDMFYTIMNTILKIISYILTRAGDLLTSLFHIMVNSLKIVLKPFLGFFGKFVKSVHHRLGSLFPFHIRDKLEEIFLYSGLTRNPEETLGMTLMYSVLVPITVGLITFALTGEKILSIGTGIASFILVWIIMYMLLNLLVDRRTENVERVLPDLLSMIAQNMSAGMTPYNALWVAARPEFGPLALEMQAVARDTLTGTPLDTALISMSKRIKSEKLQRTVKLMVQGMRSGGELPTVLQEISKDIRTERNLVKRMESETNGQVMFILFSLIIDLGKLPQEAQMGMVRIQPLSITEGDFVLYSLIVLSVSSFLGSLLIGLMRSGKMTSGIPIIPIAMGLSIGIFLALRYILSSFFGGIMTGM
ncbi:MAG: hypothetical protein B6U86_02655 [Candidatus Altiarchaeales archaeon ex4484_43]|nr:MAG: hypothetical protein B6U86_02655 [Candidatus Altiarchaeales archaeon ex4484_43]